jgi:hypothetical protein
LHLSFPKADLIVKKEKDDLNLYYINNLQLGSVKAVYRNLRENYEYRLRYDEAGKFFIKEMELKRKYREAPSVSVFGNKLNLLLVRLNINKSGSEIEYELKENSWLRRNVFSLTGLYYHLSRYGEDLMRPTLVGIVILALSTLFWSMQSDPSLYPTFSSNMHNPYSNFSGLPNHIDKTQLLKAFERSFADFIPFLSFGEGSKLGIVDYIVKITGGALTFGLIAIALRRRFERKYTR